MKATIFTLAALAVTALAAPAPQTGNAASDEVQEENASADKPAGDVIGKASGASGDVVGSDESGDESGDEALFGIILGRQLPAPPAPQVAAPND